MKESKQMQLDNLYNSKCNSCKGTDTIHKYILFLKLLECESEIGAPIKNENEDLYQCKHCRFQSLKKKIIQELYNLRAQHEMPILQIIIQEGNSINKHILFHS